jgi:hypothetical protein
LSGFWTRWCAFGLCGALVAALFAATGAWAQESEPNTACRGLRAGDQVDVVLLLDQSSSMGDAATRQVREGIGIVGGRLQELIGQGVDVRWAVVGFGSESLEGGRILLSLSPISSGADGFQELQSAYTTSDPNTDYRSGLLGAREQLRGSTAECRLLLWFTDGQFDVGPDGKDPGDAPAVIDGVCASESGVADWFQDSNVLSYVILSNDWDIGKWEGQFTSEGVLEASLSVMQAITGSGDLADGEIGKKEPAFADLLERKEYEVDAACFPYTQGRAEVGEVLLNAGDLDDIFDVLMAKTLGDIFATGSCPSSALQPASEPGRFLVKSNPLPDGLFLDQVKIYNLNGEESALSVFAQPAGDSQQRQPLRLIDKAIDSTQLKQFAAGWIIEVEGPGDMEICIAYPALERAGRAVVDVELDDRYPSRPEASQDTSLFSVDLSGVPMIERALREGRSLDGLLVGFGVDDKDWSRSWSGGTAAELTFEPNSPGTVESVDLWIDVKTGADGSPDRISLDGILRPTIEATPPPDAPTITCGEDGTGEVQELGLNGGEVPTEAFVSSIECTVSPPKDDVAIVDFSLSGTDNDSFEDLGFVFATSNGIFGVGETETLTPSDDPLTFRLEIPEALENSTWRTGGTFVVTVTWDRPGTDTPYTDDVAVEVPVDLLARSDMGFALLLTLLIAALAVLVSFGLFWFMNSLVKIPKPDGFFARSADIKIVNTTTGAPRFEWVDESQLEDASVVKADRPGRDLIADGVTLTRRVPPFFKPWKNMTARAAGFNTIHSSPAAGKSEAPGSFSELVLVATNDSPNEAGELDARVTVLHPKTHPPETPKLKIEIDQMIAPLVAQVTDKSDPAPTGTPSPRGSSDQTTDDTTPEPPERPSNSGGGVAPPPNRPSNGGGGGIAPPPNRPSSSGGGVASPPNRPGADPGSSNPPPPRRDR